MNIWIVKTGESIPSDGKKVRLFRAGLISKFLSQKGHKVVWWNADFDHQNKRHRNLEGDSFKLNDNLEVVTLKSMGYSKSISIRRIIDHIQLANHFTKLAKKSPKPDIIFCAFPTIDLASKVVDYGRKNKVPVVIDIRDLWPDIFMERLFPKLPSFFSNVFLWPFNLKVNNLLKKSNGVTSVSPPMLDWGLKRIPNKPNITTGVFPFAYFQKEISEQEYQQAYQKLSSLGLFKVKPQIRICLFATLNNSFDIETIIQAAENYTEHEVQFILCGKGERLEQYIESSKHLDNVFFPGWVYNDEIKTIMKHSDLGLAPYVDSVGFKYNLTNKPIEYISASLPVLTCVDGYLKELVEENNCGYYYQIRSSESLVKVLNNILENPDQLVLFKKNAYQLFKTNFEGINVYEKLIEYFELIIKNYKNGSKSNSRFN